MDGLRKQYKKAHSLFSISKLDVGSVNCPHCQKAIIFSDIVAECPYCPYKAQFRSETLICKGCKKCNNPIKYFSCPHCQKLILTDSHLPETTLFAKTYLRTPETINVEPLKKVLSGISNFLGDPANKEVADFLDEKVFNYVNNWFHNLDMKSVKNATEKMKELHKQNIMKIDELERLAKFNKEKAKSTEEHRKADLLSEAVKHYSELPPLLQVYLITSLFGSTETQVDDIKFDQEMRDALIKIKEEEIRKMKNENNFEEYRNKEKMKGDGL